MGERKWVERNGSNRPPVPLVEPSPFRNWVEWTWVDLEKCQVQGRQHIDFDPSPLDPIRPQSIRPKLFDQKGRPNSFRPISFDPFHAILLRSTYQIFEWDRNNSDRNFYNRKYSTIWIKNSQNRIYPQVRSTQS